MHSSNATEHMWQTGRIKDLPIKIIDGDRSYRYPKVEEFQKEGIIFLNSTMIIDNKLDYENANFISNETFAKLTKGKLKIKDIVLTTRGNGIGKVVLFNNPKFQTGFINAQMLIIRPDARLLDPVFLYYFLCGENFQRNAKNFATGSAQPQLPIQNLNNIEIFYPAVPNQRRIAAILSAYDDLIENNTRRIKILEEMAQATYREWFVYFRFPGHESVQKVESELGLIPEGWEILLLKNLAEINSESVKRNQEPKKIGYIDIASVSTGRIDNINWMKFSDAPGRARRIVRHGDIIWSMVRPNRKSYCLILEPDPNTIVSTGFAVIRCKKIPYTFLYHSLITNDFVSYLVNNATGAAYPAVKTEDFENAKTVVPSNILLEQFHKIIEPFYSMIQNLSMKNTNLRRSRDYLLPKLINGEIDVSNLDIKFPAADN